MDQPAQNLPANTPKAPAPPRQYRISPKIRDAIRTRLRKGIAWDECAKAVGLSPNGLWKARQKPHVKALYDQELQAYIKEVEAMRAPLKAMAIEHAAKLAREAKSEAVQARMVEFLAGESRAQTSVNVSIQNNVGGSGYEFVPPGAKLVDITPADPGAETMVRKDRTEDEA